MPASESRRQIVLHVQLGRMSRILLALIAIAVLVLLVLSIYPLIGRAGGSGQPTRRSGFTASGYLTVRSPSELPEPAHDREPLRPQELSLYQETYAAVLMHSSLLMDALDAPGTGDTIRSTNWFTSFNNQADPMDARRKDLCLGLFATPVPNSRLIKIELTTPVREDAKVILEALVDVFVERVTRDQKDGERKKIELLTKEQKLLQNDLDMQISGQLASIEGEFGSSDPTLPINAKRLRIEQWQKDRESLQREIAVLEAEYRSIMEDKKNGKALPQIELALSRQPRIVALQKRLDDLNVEVGQIESIKPAGEELAPAKARTASLKKVMEEVREELRENLIESELSRLQGQILSNKARLTFAEEMAAMQGRELGKMCERVSQHEVLKDKERRVREKIGSLEAEIRRIREFRLAVPWKLVEWSARPQLPDSK